MSTRANALLQRAALLAASAARRVTRNAWTPPFSDVRPIIADLWGKPISSFIRRAPGDEIKINPLRWYNGHPGEHVVQWRCDPPDAIEWTKNVYGVQYGIARKEGTFVAHAIAPGAQNEPPTIFATQVVRITFVQDYTGNANA